MSDTRSERDSCGPCAWVSDDWVCVHVENVGVAMGNKVQTCFRLYGCVVRTLDYTGHGAAVVLCSFMPGMVGGSDQHTAFL